MYPARAVRTARSGAQCRAIHRVKNLLLQSGRRAASAGAKNDIFAKSLGIARIGHAWGRVICYMDCPNLDNGRKIAPTPE